VDPTRIDLRPAIDRSWLEDAARRDPLGHAYALWDLTHAPDRIRIVSALAGDRTIGYLLLWLGHPTASVVHWVGTDPRGIALARALPPRPLVAIVPEGFREAARRERGPAAEYPLLGLRAEPLLEERGFPPEEGVRLLTRRDRPRLVRWTSSQSDPVVAEYTQLDPGAEPVWGAFLGPDLVGVVRAAVRLPLVWVLGGVYVDPIARGQGLGRALVRSAQRAAAVDGAPAALFVREDRLAARTLYESLGFRRVASRTWLDAGAGLVP